MNIGNHLTTKNVALMIILSIKLLQIFLLIFDLPYPESSTITIAKVLNPTLREKHAIKNLKLEITFDLNFDIPDNIWNIFNTAELVVGGHTIDTINSYFIENLLTRLDSVGFIERTSNKILIPLPFELSSDKNCLLFFRLLYHEFKLKLNFNLDVYRHITGATLHHQNIDFEKYECLPENVYKGYTLYL